MEKFLEVVGDISLSAEPITTIWGICISAAMYYADHFEVVKIIVNEFDLDEEQDVEEAKRILLKKKIK